MKKQILSIILILTILASITACADNNSVQTSGKAPVTNSSPVTTGDNSQGTEPTPDPEKTVYDLLNTLSKQSYGKVSLSITTVTGDIELGANYVLTDKNITYSYDKLNMLPSDGNIESLAPNYKTTISGTASVTDGKITSFDGSEIDLPSYDELSGALDFNEKYFSNVKDESGKFTASVTSPCDFLGADKDSDLNDMNVSVEYSDLGISKITLTYRTSLSSVSCFYEFEK